jgi:predicted molibdopterin-dependent oxidoreductase YjgC
LIRADKSPNTTGAALLGLAGPLAPEAGAIVDAALSGQLDFLWVFGHDLFELFGAERAHGLADALPLLVFSGTNENATARLAHWVLPTAAYVEKDGTFVNCQGRVQRIGRAFKPLADSREDWRLLLELAERSGLRLSWRDPEAIFAALATAEAPFAGLSYAAIGDHGAPIAGTPK